MYYIRWVPNTAADVLVNGVFSGLFWSGCQSVHSFLRPVLLYRGTVWHWQRNAFHAAPAMDCLTFAGCVKKTKFEDAHETTVSSSSTISLLIQLPQRCEAEVFTVNILCLTMYISDELQLLRQIEYVLVHKNRSFTKVIHYSKVLPAKVR